MSTFEELAAAQRATGDTIQQIICNFKKDSVTRHNQRYFEQRIQRLEESAEEFRATNQKILELTELPRNHDYFALDYFVSIMALVSNYVKKFKSMLAELDAKQTGDLNPSTSFQVHVSDELTDPPKLNDVTIDCDLSKTFHRLLRKQEAMLLSLDRQLANVSAEGTDHPIEFYNFKISVINQLWQQVQDVHYKLWELEEEPTAMGYKVDHYIEMETRVQQQLIDLSIKARTTTTPTYTENFNLHLPQVTIPRFDGDYLKWPQFFDLFSQLIHSKPLPKIQKMWYLKTNLTGEAERLIRHLALTEDNYTTAWETLQNRFHNKRILTSALIHKLLSQPSHTTDLPSASTIKTLHDVTKETILALQNLGISVKEWDPLLLYILVKKLDSQSHMLYEQSLINPRENQSITEFLQFLEGRFQSLEAIGKENKKSNAKICAAATNEKPNSLCKICHSGEHAIYACKQFLQLSPTARLQSAQKINLCINCLRSGHKAQQCTSRNCCKCNKKHNTLLHFETNTRDQSAKKLIGPSQKTSSNIEQQPVTLTASTPEEKSAQILLSTARVKITAVNGQTLECRAMLDSGSQVNLITERTTKRLGITLRPSSTNFKGVCDGSITSQYRVSVNLQSRLNRFCVQLEALVLPHIVADQPSVQVDVSSWPIPKNIVLADPLFNIPDKIDILLGAEFYHQLLSIGQIKLDQNLPTLQNTVLGWIVSGRVGNQRIRSATCGSIEHDDQALASQMVERFWKLDDLSTSEPTFTQAEIQCERHFAQNTKRSSNGRFLVRLPFLDNPCQLGESRQLATNRFLALERKFTKNNDLREQYVKFMDEYEALGQMTEVDLETIISPMYFIPHHAVHRPSSSTTKLRVVFDASAKTSTGVSLNDILFNGPTVQNELFSILLRFRLPRFVFTTDIEKMYRQVFMHPDDRKFQLIVWRKDPKESLKFYQLNTVTYGTRAAPYLATKCLQQLGKEYVSTLPLGAQALKNDFYVDDGVTGNNNLNTAIEMQRQLITILTSAGFRLQKWCANHPQLLQGLPNEDKEVNLDFNTISHEEVKTLGLTWIPKTDNFCIKTMSPDDKAKITKRTVVSELAKIFDPLGMLAPVVVTAKIFVQRLWELKLTWDESLPLELHTKWQTFRTSLQNISDMQIPRHIHQQKIAKTIQIHVFSDASEKAYGSAVYLRSCFADKSIAVRLLCAKSRVAPLKKQTLPRLELCAAVLGAQLVARVKSDLHYCEIPTFMWTDSQIVLNWINSSSASYKTFVANRIAAIHDLTLQTQWRHVGSRENPADILSRGASPSQLKASLLWLYGPRFLHGNESIWPPAFNKDLNSSSLENEEIKKSSVALTITTDENPGDVLYKINHRNSFRTLQRIVAYMVRFTRCKLRRYHHSPQLSPTTTELEEALAIIIRNIQAADFQQEIEQLSKGKPLSNTSSLLSLSPFLDERGIIRVGGRIDSALLSYDAKHQMLLPYNDSIARMLMEMLHKQHHHCGAQALLAHTRQRFWPIKGKTMARSIIQRCVYCSRAKPKLLTQVMGDLPATRVQPARPFLNVGVDYCGPFWAHHKIRGRRPYKVYIAVFCCFTTKAVHLDLVGDLTTEAFIGCLKRFISRRGHCINIYCDNATNFVGAKNQLAELQNSLFSKDAKDSIIESCAHKGITFNFIPPRSPHFGGLWEAAVKSAKNLLLKTVSSVSLTYEELETVIAEVEAVLNSRPITPMSNDPNDLEALTPGHFLIGAPLTSTLDSRAAPCKASLLTRWKLVSHLKHEFWKRWSNEYLNELQYRHKWTREETNAEPGLMVIIKDDNLPPLKWPLGRIESVHKGLDGRVRVADVRTATGICTRAIHRLAPLPLKDMEAQAEVEPGRGRQNQTEVPLGEQINEQINSCETPTKKRRTSGYSNVVITAILLLILPLVIGSPVKNINFESKPGLYFEGIGHVNAAASEWKLIVYYDLQSLKTEISMLSTGIRALKHICQIVKQNESCMSLVEYFKHAELEVMLENTLLSPKRRKRGALNLVGNIARSLFGVLDSDYADEMTKTIDRIAVNEDELLKLIKNQTTIIDSTINIIKRNEIHIKTKLDQWDNVLKQFANKIQQTQEEIRQNEAWQSLMLISVQLTAMISSLQRSLSLIINVLTDAHHGTISPLLLSPQQLSIETAKLKTHLPTDLRLPIENENLLQLYKLMKAEAGITEKHVIFYIRLPLISPTRFDVFNVIPIPMVVNDTIVSIKPSLELIAINPHQDQFFPLTKTSLASCVVVSTDSYLCFDVHSIFTVRTKAYACEIGFLTNDTTSDCTFATTTIDNVWTHLHSKNQWIYAVKSDVKFTAICGNQMHQVRLTGVGLLELEPDCVAKYQKITLNGLSTISNTIHTSYASFGKITQIFSPSQINRIQINGSMTYDPHLEKLEALQKTLKLQNLQNLPSIVQDNHLHNTAVGYTALILTIIGLAWTWLKLRKTMKNSKSATPTPAPRQQPKSEFQINV